VRSQRRHRQTTDSGREGDERTPSSSLEQTRKWAHEFPPSQSYLYAEKQFKSNFHDRQTCGSVKPDWRPPAVEEFSLGTRPDCIRVRTGGLHAARVVVPARHGFRFARPSKALDHFFDI